MEEPLVVAAVPAALVEPLERVAAGLHALERRPALGVGAALPLGVHARLQRREPRDLERARGLRVAGAADEAREHRVHAVARLELYCRAGRPRKYWGGCSSRNDGSGKDGGGGGENERG